MAVGVRHMRRGNDRRRRRIGLAVLSDNEIIGIFIAVIRNRTQFYVPPFKQTLAKFTDVLTGTFLFISHKVVYG